MPLFYQLYFTIDLNFVTYRDAASLGNSIPAQAKIIAGYLAVHRKARLGYTGIEFEGQGISEEEGIRRTKELLVKEGNKPS